MFWLLCKNSMFLHHSRKICWLPKCRFKKRFQDIKKSDYPVKHHSDECKEPCMSSNNLIETFYVNSKLEKTDNLFRESILYSTLPELRHQLSQLWKIRRVVGQTRPDDRIRTLWHQRGYLIGLCIALLQISSWQQFSK